MVFDLTDEDLGLILEGKGAKLHEGDKERAEVVRELAQILVAEDDVLVREGTLKSRGIANFGRENEGRAGVALFVPHDDDGPRGDD